MEEKLEVTRYTRDNVMKHVGKLMPPIALQSLLAAIVGHMSSDAVAASSVALIVFSIAASFAIAYGNSTGIILGQQLGCGDTEEAKVCGDKLLKGAAIMGLMLCIIVCALSPVIPRFVTNLNDEAKRYLFWMIIIVGVKCIGKGINHTLATGIFCAGGRC